MMKYFILTFIRVMHRSHLSNLHLSESKVNQIDKKSNGEYLDFSLFLYLINFSLFIHLFSFYQLLLIYLFLFYDSFIFITFRSVIFLYNFFNIIIIIVYYLNREITNIQKYLNIPKLDQRDQLSNQILFNLILNFKGIAMCFLLCIFLVDLG